MRKAKTLGRCNYCRKDAVVGFSWQSWVSKMGHRRALTMTAQACAEHEGCVNWNSVRALHPDAPLVRAAC